MDLRAVAAKTAGRMADSYVPFTGPIVEALIADFLQVQDEQFKMLRRFEGSIALLTDGPWQTARIHLEDAALSGRTDEQVLRSLTLAAERLHDAIPLQPLGSIARSQARLDLALVFSMLKDVAACRHHAANAYGEARRALWTLVNAGRNGSRRRSPSGDNAAGAVGSALNGWYLEAEFCASLLGDPASDLSLVSGDIPALGATACFERSYDVSREVRWRSGADVDFAYTLYKQRYVIPVYAIDILRGCSWPLEEFLAKAQPPLPAPETLSAMWEQRSRQRELEEWVRRDQALGYFTGMED